VKNMPRILPLVGVAMGGVLAVNALAGARGLPDLLGGAKAFAEEAANGGKAAPAAKGETAAVGAAKDAAATLPGLPSPSIRPQAVCAPTAAELAKAAGLSPAELQVLQSLGDRRGQLDQREGELDTQLALLAAAEAKLDAKVKALNGLKGDIQGLLTQAESREQAEIDRLVKVFEGMKAKDAAPRLMVLDDAVRLPIAGKMKERSLSAIIAVMPAQEAKKLTEALAKRFTDARLLAANAQAQANGAAPAAKGQPAPRAATPPARTPAARAAAPAAATPPAAPAAKAG
jgi:flagellar motility protein MotE (MotC chaperone)